MRSPWAARPGQEAHAGGLAGTVCVSVCVYVRDTICSQFPLTSRSQAAPALELSALSCFGVCVVGSSYALWEDGTGIQSQAPTWWRLWARDLGGALSCPFVNI